MKILVTGAAGFIGFHLCRTLLERGEEVVAKNTAISASSNLDLKTVTICKHFLKRKSSTRL